MTLNEMKRSEKNFLTPMDVCEILECAPYSINVKVKNEGVDSLPFPAFTIGRVVKIPRAAFVSWAETMGLR